LSAQADLNGPAVVPHSRLSINDNNMDPFHVYWLHAAHGTLHFTREHLIMPEVEFEEVRVGSTFRMKRTLEDGRRWDFVLTWLVPNVCVNPGPVKGPGGHLTIMVPVDDNHVRVFNCARVDRSYTRPYADQNLAKLKPWTEMTIEERQAAPNDYEAQSSQGPDGIQLHSQEHMVTSDRGVALQRQILRREIKKVLRGEDPINVAFRAGEDVIRDLPSGNFYSDPVG
jgi:hypothetical protein